MLVTISTTRDPATDLGFLLHKHPEKVQSFPVTAGTAHVFYPEATPQRCTAALVLEVGGYLSHGAIVAREYGLPAVANLPGVLTAVRDGQILTVDGDAGRVELG